MAAPRTRLSFCPLLLLLLLLLRHCCGSERRFSDLKRCADSECSMLLGRGKAVQDFTGPDCRFLSFKKGETIYVYYKLSGQRSDVWAGSVGNNFGYFPKDYLSINHVYTEKELEVPAEETDFVCFDTGLDKFENYDIDVLLGSLILADNEDLSGEFKATQVPSEPAEPTETPESQTLPSEPSEEHGSEDLHFGSVTPTADSQDSEHDATEKPAEISHGEDAERSVGDEEEPDLSELDLDSEVYHDQSSSAPVEAPGKVHDFHQPSQLDVKKLEREDQPAQTEPDAEDKPLQTDAKEMSEEENMWPTVDDSPQSVPVTSERESQVTDVTEEPTDPTVPVSSGTELEGVHVPEPSQQSADATSGQDQTQEHSYKPPGDDNLESEIFVSTSPLVDELDLRNVEHEMEDHIQKPIINTEAQDAVLSSVEKTNAPPEEENPWRTAELHESEDQERTESESSGKPADDQKNNVKNQLLDLLRNTLESEQQSSQDGGKPHDDNVKDVQPQIVESSLLQQGGDISEYKSKDEKQTSQVAPDRQHEDNNGFQSQTDETNVPQQDENTSEFHQIPNVSLENDDDGPHGEEKHQDEALPDFQSQSDNVDIPQHGDTQLSRPSIVKLKNHDEDTTSIHDKENPQDEGVNDDGEELLEDENALLFASDVHEPEENHREGAEEERRDVPSQPDDSSSPRLSESSSESSLTSSPGVHDEESTYSEDVLRLTILRNHMADEETQRMQQYIGLKNLFRIEAMFSDLEQEMKSAKEHQADTEEIEKSLDQIAEASENSILDATEEMFSERARGRMKEAELEDLEADILDTFQEMVFSIRQKYSSVSDSVPLVEEEDGAADAEAGEEAEDVKDSADFSQTEPQEQMNGSELSLKAELNVRAEDGGHFNRNQESAGDLREDEEIHKDPRATPESPVDIGFHLEMDPSSGSLETPAVSEFHESDSSSDIISSSHQVWTLMLLLKECVGVYAEILLTALPEEWRPGPTFHGLAWEPVLLTGAVGVFTLLVFCWRSVLAVKGRSCQLTEKQLKTKIQRLLSEKSEAVTKISELEETIRQREEQLSRSQTSLSSGRQQVDQLKEAELKLREEREEMTQTLAQLKHRVTHTQQENAALREKVGVMQERMEKHRDTLHSLEEERAQVVVRLDEAKLCEDALKAQLQSYQRDNTALKEQKRRLAHDASDWQEKHQTLSEQIRVYHRTHTELQDSLVHKDNEIDVLSSCVAELNRLGSCDAPDDSKLSNGEEAERKRRDATRLRIKQMTDVSRISATLSVVEEERNRLMEKLLREQEERQRLEERYEKVTHEQMNLKNEKTQLETQMKKLQQRLEITTELYQQKENTLQQKLTHEELQRREKETRLSQADGAAERSEEELRELKQKMKEMEEEMQQNERSLKSEVAVQEKKAHENWLKARASERTLVEERREAVTLRQKLVEYRDQISDLEQSLFKVNVGPSERHAPPPRRGDSFGPSPVSGGAPSPPLMMEGPARPPSAPAGRRMDAFGARPPSDPHGRFSDLGHPLPTRPVPFAPLTSSPAHDGPMTNDKPETSEPVQPQDSRKNPGSFLPSPIRDSPVPAASYEPPMMGGPMPPNGPPPLMMRPPNGHAPMMAPRFRPPHLEPYGPPPPFARAPPPDFFAPRGFPPRPFPPSGVMVPPPYGGRGFSGAAPQHCGGEEESEGVAPDSASAGF